MLEGWHSGNDSEWFLKREFKISVMALTTLTRFTLQGLLDADGKPYKGSEVWAYPIIITKTHLIGPTFTLVKVLSNDHVMFFIHMFLLHSYGVLNLKFYKFCSNVSSLEREYIVLTISHKIPTFCNI